nr:hypothetical protein [Desulforamulus profundi]
MADYALRAPLKTCTLHTQDGIDPAAAEKYKLPVILPQPNEGNPGEGENPPTEPGNGDNWLPGTTGRRQPDEIKNDSRKAAKIRETIREKTREYN